MDTAAERVAMGEVALNRWWRVVGGLSMNLALGALYAWSTYVAPLEQEFGWTRDQTSQTFSIAVIVFALSFVVAGWQPAPAPRAAATTHEFSPAETLRTPTFYFMWVAYACGTFAGLMVISQLVPFAKDVGLTTVAGTTLLVVGAAGNAGGRILSGWLSDAVGRLNVLRLMIAISAVGMPILYLVGDAQITFLTFVMIFVIYWCYGTQLSVNASTTSDFWGTRNAGINYGMLFLAWGVAGYFGPRVGGALFDRYGNYQAAFWIAAGLAAVALVSELLARRPKVPAEAAQAQPAPGS